MNFKEFITTDRESRNKEKFEGTKSLELRVSELEKKLQEIKLKMESQKAEKKSFLKVLKSRFTNWGLKLFIIWGSVCLSLVS